MPALANPRHERFARFYLRSGNASQAYVLAGYSCEPHGARANACRLIAKSNVKRRVDELRRGLGRRSEVSATSLIEDLQADRRLAISLKRPGDAIKATMGVARIAGLLIEKREVGSPGGFDRAETLRQIAERHGQEVVDLLRQALGESTSRVPQSLAPSGQDS